MLAKARSRHEPIRGIAPTVVRSIAVLPLQSTTSATDYLSLSMADELTSALASVPGLRTAPVSSTARFKPDRDLHELGSLLNVGAVLQGEIHNTKDRLHIMLTVQSLAGDSTLWSRQFTGDTGDLRRIESEMAAAVAGTLRDRGDPPVAPSATVAARNPAAHKLVLRALSLRERRAALDSAIGLLDHATRLDSGYARAWITLASLLTMTIESRPPDAAARRARATAAARKAIALDESLAEPHALLGRLLADGGDRDHARHEFLTAIRLGPRLAWARYGYSQLLSTRGQSNEAVREARRAHELDPLAADVHMNYVLMLERAGRTADAQHETAELRRIGKYLTPRQ